MCHHAAVTLAQRLLLAFTLLVLATTGAFGYGVQRAVREAEQTRLDRDVERAVERLGTELARQAELLPGWLAQLCEHDPAVDAALLEQQLGRSRGARASIAWRTPELRRAYGVDQVRILLSDGSIVGASDRACDGAKSCPADALVGTREPELLRALLKAERGRPAKALGGGLELLVSEPALSGVGTGADPVIVGAHCTRRASERAAIRIFASRSLAPLMAEIGGDQGLELALARWPNDDQVGRPLRGLAGRTLFARRSVERREREARALEQLEGTVLALGAGSLGAALLLAWLLARGLTGPLVELAEQARRVTSGDLAPVRVRGTREVRALALALNGTLADLLDLRRRLAVSERIAARREIARQVAHEIKNPLAPIRAAIETLRRLRARNDPAFDEYFDEASRTVLDEVARISNIVSEFTRFARLPAPVLAPVDPVAVAEQVVSLHATGGSNVRLVATATGPIIADRDQLVQVLTNLVQNGLDAGGAVTVTLGPAAANTGVGARAPAPTSGTPSSVARGAPATAPAAASGKLVELRVSDDGPGVPPELAPRLFEPYFTTKPHGTGLGLAIVQRIIVEHGGDIRYEPGPHGRGAVLVVLLPVAGPALLVRAPESGAAPDSTPTPA